MKLAACLFFGLVILLSGCASDGGKVWYQQGRTFAEMNRSLADCRLQAKRVANPLAMVNLGFALAEDIRQKDMVRDCMVSKGYVFISRNSIPAGVIWSAEEQIALDQSDFQKLIGRWSQQNAVEFPIKVEFASTGAIIFTSEAPNGLNMRGGFYVKNSTLYLRIGATEEQVPFMFASPLLLIMSHPSDLKTQLKFQRSN